jgi:hypothetical protein
VTQPRESCVVPSSSRVGSPQSFGGGGSLPSGSTRRSNEVGATCPRLAGDPPIFIVGLSEGDVARTATEEHVPLGSSTSRALKLTADDRALPCDAWLRSGVFGTQLSAVAALSLLARPQFTSGSSIGYSCCLQAASILALRADIAQR